MTRSAQAKLALLVGLVALTAVPAHASAARTLSIADASKAEPASGSSPMKFTITLSRAHQSKTVKTSYGTEPGSADALDFQPSFGTAKIKPGKTKATVSVPVRSDLFSEPDESFEVELFSPSRATIDDGVAEGLIGANDNGPDGDGDGIPDADDCAPGDPNPPDALQCYEPTTIYDINQGNIDPGTRAYIENVLVTAQSQNGGVAYGAIVPGDSGYAGQDFSALELENPGNLVNLSPNVRYRILGSTREGGMRVHRSDQTDCCESIPGPLMLTPAAFAAAGDEINGLLVEVSGGSIASSSRDAWNLTEGFAVDDDLFPSLPQHGPGTGFEFIRGHATTIGGEVPALSPRDLGDLDPTIAQLFGFNSSDTCLLPGEQDVVIGQVQLDEVQATDTVVAVEAEDPDVLTVPPTVTVLAGQTTADVVADAPADPAADFTVVTATLAPFEYELFVDVSSEFC